MQEYTVLEARKWNKDNIFSVTFLEAKGEPIDYFDPPSHPTVGEKITGKIEQYKTNTGSVRNKFVTQETIAKEDDKQLEINTSWAITNALQIALGYEKDQIKAAAEMLLEIKQELKENR